MKILKLLLILLLVAVLFGCAGEKAETFGNRTPLGAETINNQEIPERHLAHYNDLDHYNQHDYFNGFKVSEFLDGEELYYVFTREDANIRVLMNEEGETTVYLGDRSATFTSAFMMAGGGTEMHWIDLTGDKKPEYVHTLYTNGTGFHPDSTWIFDGDTFQELEILDFTQAVKETFSEIADIHVCGTEYYVNADGGLEARGVVMLPDAPKPTWYYGEAIGELIWNRSEQAFVLKDPMEALAFEEVT